MKEAVLLKRSYYHLALIVLLVVIVYGNSLRNGFNIDDAGLLLNNSAVHGFSSNNIWKIFTSVPNGVEYLPVRDLTYCLDFTLWGDNPLGYHLANMMYYIIACVVLYLLFVKILVQWTVYHKETAFFAVLLFVVHPVHVESVAGIAQRKDLVSGIFFFLSIYFFMSFKENTRWRFYLLSVLFFIFAFLSKATVVILPLLIFLLDSYSTEGKESGISVRLIRILPYLIFSVLLTLIQITILSDAGIIKSELSGLENEWAVRIFTAAKAVFYYLRLLITGHPLNIMHDFNYARQLLAPKVIVSSIALCALIFGIVTLRKRSRLLSFAGSWYLVCLIPVVGLIPSATLVAERYLFLPSAGFCLAVGYLMSMALERRSILIMAIAFYCLLILYFTTTAHNRTHDWKDALTLYRSGMDGFPDNPRLHWLAGRELFWAKNYEKSFKCFSTAQSIDPSYSIDYKVFSAVRAYKEHQYTVALMLLNQIKLPANINVSDIDYMYGMIYTATGEREKALRYLQRAEKDRVRLGIIYKKNILTALQ